MWIPYEREAVVVRSNPVEDEQVLPDMTPQWSEEQRVEPTKRLLKSKGNHSDEYLKVNRCTLFVVCAPSLHWPLLNSVVLPFVICSGDDFHADAGSAGCNGSAEHITHQGCE